MILSMRLKMTIHSVNLAMKYCSCYRWQVNGFPCALALAVIQRDGRDVYDFVEVSFWTSMILDSFSFFIFLVSDVDGIIEKDIAGNFLILPPKTKIPPGRPKTKRIKSIGEKSKMIKCGRCEKMGRHNRKTCNAPI